MLELFIDAFYIYLFVAFAFQKSPRRDRDGERSSRLLVFRTFHQDSRECVATIIIIIKKCYTNTHRCPDAADAEGSLSRLIHQRDSATLLSRCSSLLRTLNGTHTYRPASRSTRGTRTKNRITPTWTPAGEMRDERLDFTHVHREMRRLHFKKIVH